MLYIQSFCKGFLHEIENIEHDRKVKGPETKVSIFGRDIEQTHSRGNINNGTLYRTASLVPSAFPRDAPSPAGDEDRGHKNMQSPSLVVDAERRQYLTSFLIRITSISKAGCEQSTRCGDIRPTAGLRALISPETDQGDNAHHTRPPV